MSATDKSYKCVVLKVDGSMVEKEVVMSPGWELKLIGGPVTIYGMFEAIDTIVLGLDYEDMDEQEVNKLRKNPHKLPPPLDDEHDFYNDVVLFRNDDNAEPMDLPLSDWMDFIENPTAEKYLKAIELRRQRELEEEEGDDDDEEEEEEDGDDGEDDADNDDDEEEEEEPEPPKKKGRAGDGPPAKKSRT